MIPLPAAARDAHDLMGKPLDAGLQWVLGDEIYGSGRRLRMELERREQLLTWPPVPLRPSSAIRRKLPTVGSGDDGFAGHR